MSTDADRTGVRVSPSTPPEQPPVPAAPPRPAVPPRPSVPPRPVSPPSTAEQYAGEGEAGPEPEAEPTPEDESSTHMPNSREAEDNRQAPVPAPRAPSRPPVPTLPPQPAPPTGEPLTAPRLPARPSGPVRPERREEGRPTRSPERAARPEGFERPARSESPARPESPTPPESPAPPERPARPESPARSTGPARPERHREESPEQADEADLSEPVQQRRPGGSTRPTHPLSRPAPPLGPPPAPPTSPASRAQAPPPPPPPRDPPSGRAPLSSRTVAAAACLVLGVGLLGGAGAGAWLTDDPDERPTAGRGFDEARTAWREVPVDKLFPPTLTGKGAGPGAADRRWTRVAVAPDSGCARAFDPLLTKALSSVGCSRLVRATYADETTSSVTTVGLLFTKADQGAMRDLRKRFAVENLTERTDLMPRPYAARGTVAADFGDAQRASWTVHVLSDAPVVVYSVSGFADGRVVSDPQSAADATRKGETSAPAQAGLGNDAQGIADRVERGLRKVSTDAGGSEKDSREGLDKGAGAGDKKSEGGSEHKKGKDENAEREESRR